MGERESAEAKGRVGEGAFATSEPVPSLSWRPL